MSKPAPAPGGSPPTSSPTAHSRTQSGGSQNRGGGGSQFEGPGTGKSSCSSLLLHTRGPAPPDPQAVRRDLASSNANAAGAGTAGPSKPAKAPGSNPSTLRLAQARPQLGRSGTGTSAGGAGVASARAKREATLATGMSSFGFSIRVTKSPGAQAQAGTGGGKPSQAASGSSPPTPSRSLSQRRSPPGYGASGRHAIGGGGGGGGGAHAGTGAGLASAALAPGSSGASASSGSTPAGMGNSLKVQGASSGVSASGQGRTGGRTLKRGPSGPTILTAGAHRPSAGLPLALGANAGAPGASGSAGGLSTPLALLRTQAQAGTRSAQALGLIDPAAFLDLHTLTSLPVLSGLGKHTSYASSERSGDLQAQSESEDWRVSAYMDAPPSCVGSQIAATPEPLIPMLLEFVGLEHGDSFYDLGSGSGEVVLAAAKEKAVLAVGVEANMQCYKRSKFNHQVAMINLELHPRSEVAWQLQDITELELDYFMPAGQLYGPTQFNRIVVFAFLSPRQMHKIKALLLALIRAGARVATYDSHLHLDAGDRETVMTVQQYDGLLQLHMLRRSMPELDEIEAVYLRHRPGGAASGTSGGSDGSALSGRLAVELQPGSSTTDSSATDTGSSHARSSTATGPSNLSEPQPPTSGSLSGREWAEAQRWAGPPPTGKAVTTGSSAALAGNAPQYFRQVSFPSYYSDSSAAASASRLGSGNGDGWDGSDADSESEFQPELPLALAGGLAHPEPEPMLAARSFGDSEIDDHNYFGGVFEF